MEKTRCIGRLVLGDVVRLASCSSLDGFGRRDELLDCTLFFVLALLEP